MPEHGPRGPELRTRLTQPLFGSQDIQVSSRLLDKLQKKVEAAAEGDERAAYFQHVAEAISTFSAAADQVAVLRDLDQSPAAQLLHQELEDVCLRVDTTRNALYAVLLVALQRRLEQVRCRGARIPTPPVVIYFRGYDLGLAYDRCCAAGPVEPFASLLIGSHSMLRLRPPRFGRHFKRAHQWAHPSDLSRLLCGILSGLLTGGV